MSFVSQVSSTVPITHSVTYKCTFTNNWSEENHPIDYPESNAHWSTPVIAAHTYRYSMWEAGALATEGVERVAESGSTIELIEELGAAGAKVGDVVEGSTTYNKDTQSQTFQSIKLTPWFDRMSSITMVAPSPDWFTGFDSLVPIDTEALVWLESFEVATQPWDAGTEQGEGYSTSNNPENPPVGIFELTKDTVPDSGILLNGDQTGVLPMATWKCTLEANACEDHTGFRHKKKANRDCSWVGRPRRSRRRNKRCNKRHAGRYVSDYCPQACRICSVENTM